ncbi:MAG: hypothetical protein JST54_27390 [Deltaproteobacteria bacterium]|nr:hypothetical protein [Deltaproteobacteria bacterium]
MACRFLESRGHLSRRCGASEPSREPSAVELKELCLAADQRGCPYHRFRKCSGRALRQEDHRAWEHKRRDEAARKAQKPAPPSPPRPRTEPGPSFIIESLAPPFSSRGGHLS